MLSKLTLTKNLVKTINDILDFEMCLDSSRKFQNRIMHMFHMFQRLTFIQHSKKIKQMNLSNTRSLLASHQWPSWLLVFLSLPSLQYSIYRSQPVQEHIRCKNKWVPSSDSKHNTILFIVGQRLQGSIWKLGRMILENFWSWKLSRLQIWTMWPLCQIDFTKQCNTVQCDTINTMK